MWILYTTLWIFCGLFIYGLTHKILGGQFDKPEDVIIPVISGPFLVLFVLSYVVGEHIKPNNKVFAWICKALNKVFNI